MPFPRNLLHVASLFDYTRLFRMPTREVLIESAERLQFYLCQTHYKGGILQGPDPGVRFNLHAWRYLKSALDFVPWENDYVFTQTQGYWVLGNWQLFDATGDPR